MEYYDFLLLGELSDITSKLIKVKRESNNSTSLYKQKQDFISIHDISQLLRESANTALDCGRIEVVSNQTRI